MAHVFSAWSSTSIPVDHPKWNHPKPPKSSVGCWLFDRFPWRAWPKEGCSSEGLKFSQHVACRNTTLLHGNIPMFNSNTLPCLHCWVSTYITRSKEIVTILSLQERVPQLPSIVTTRWRAIFGQCKREKNNQHQGWKCCFYVRNNASQGEKTLIFH